MVGDQGAAGNPAQSPAGGDEQAGVLILHQQRAGERGVNGDIGARENRNLRPIVQVDTVGGGRASPSPGASAGRGLGRRPMAVSRRLTISGTAAVSL